MALVGILQEHFEGAAVIKAGAPLVRISGLSVKEEITRIKSEVPNDNLDKIKLVEAHLDDQMGELEQIYRKVGIA